MSGPSTYNAGAAPVQLPPLPSAIGVLSPFVAQESVTLVIKEKVMSIADDFHVKNAATEQPVFRILGHVLSLSERKDVHDAQGNHLFSIRKQLFSIPSSYYAQDPSGNRFLSVDGKWSFGTSKSTISFQNACGDNSVVELNMKGNFLDTHADITVSGPGGVQMVVARIDRKLWNVKEIFAGKHTYFLTVAPGMDMACALAMCICLDEREQKRGRGGLLSMT